MTRRICCVISLLVILYVLCGYSKLSNLLSEVNVNNKNLEISIERQSEIMAHYGETLHEIAMYNLMLVKDTEHLIDLNNNLDRYEVELVGGNNRVAVAKSRLSESIIRYNKSITDIRFYIIVVLFKFKKIENIDVMKVAYADYYLNLTKVDD